MPQESRQLPITAQGALLTDRAGIGKIGAYIFNLACPTKRVTSQSSVAIRTRRQGSHSYRRDLTLLQDEDAIRRNSRL